MVQHKGQVTVEGAESVSIAVLDVRGWTGHLTNAPAKPLCRRDSLPRHRLPRHRLSATDPIKMSLHSRITFDYFKDGLPITHA